MEHLNDVWRHHVEHLENEHSKILQLAGLHHNISDLQFCLVKQKVYELSVEQKVKNN